MVCFVILHYMALEETILCVESIRGSVEGEKKIIVVDNCSPNGSIKGLEEKYKDAGDVDVLETGENLGFAKGNNFGYAYAVREYSPDFVVVMNNDMEIRQKDFIGQIYRSFEEYRFAVMGPDIYSTKKKYHQNPQTRKMPTRRDLEKSRRSLTIKNSLRFMIPLKWRILLCTGSPHRKRGRRITWIMLWRIRSCTVPAIFFQGCLPKSILTRAFLTAPSCIWRRRSCATSAGGTKRR